MLISIVQLPIIMAFDIFDEFVNFILWPHLVGYLFYVSIKTMSVWLEIMYDPECSGPEDEDEHYSLFCFLTCGCFFHCCCNCCKRANNPITKAMTYNLEFDRWLIKLLLGREEGVVERHHDDYQPDEDSEGKPFTPIYIRNKSLSSTEVSILTILVFMFGLLIGITAFDVYFLDVSYACTDDRSFSCFVLPVSVDTNKTELGITNQRIDSCSQWENTNISDQVYVLCYKWTYNFKGVTVTVGALLTLFKLTVKAATSILIWLNAKLHKNDHFSVKKEKLRWLHRVPAYIVFVIEVLLSAAFLVCTMIYFLGGGKNNNSIIIVRYLTEHGNQVLLVFGIIGTCLLLPIEDYIEDPTQQILTDNENELSANGRHQTNYGSMRHRTCVI